MIAEFFAKHLSRKRTARDGHYRLRRISCAFGWGDRDAASITDEEAHDCLTKLAERGYRNDRGRIIGGPVEAFACKSLSQDHVEMGQASEASSREHLPRSRC